MCDHYLDRNCLIRSVCCEKWYPCRFCHDDVETHKLIRKEITEMKCAMCDITQDLAMECTNCGIKNSDQFCETCKLLPDFNINIYHCDLCGYCLVGKEEELTHCDACGFCYFINGSEHICNPETKDESCVICLEKLIGYIEPIVKMKCGHSLHKDCYTDYCKSGHWICPVCKKTIYEITYEMTEAFDREIEAIEMPEDMRREANIMCNDCLEKSTVQYHYVGMKCISCNSYNTTEL